MNEKSRSDSYAAAGVDITAGYKAVELMKTHIARTVLQGGSEDIGGFGGLFELDITDMPHPVLVSGTDGVGTKLKLAFLMDKHDTVGIDCVAMCVNDIICCGAKPLFFLDYIACGKNFPEKIASRMALRISSRNTCRWETESTPSLGTSNPSICWKIRQKRRIFCSYRDSIIWNLPEKVNSSREIHILHKTRPKICQIP